MSSPRELLDDFLTERSFYVSESTVSDDSFHLKRFFRFLEQSGVDHIGLVELSHLDGFKHHLETVPGQRGKIASAAYKHKSLVVSRHFLSWAFSKGFTLIDFERYELPHRTDPGIIDVPSYDQVQALLDAPNPETPSGQRNRLILESFYTLALRRRESHQLDVTDLNLAKRTVRIRGKGQRERILPLTERLASLFASYVKSARPYLRPNPQESGLWVSPQTGNRLCFSYLKQVVDRYAKQLGLTNIYPHLLRHTCATHMLEGGARLEDIQAYLGHSSPLSTERYTHVGNEELKAVFRATHPRGREPQDD